VDERTSTGVPSASMSDQGEKDGVEDPSADAPGGELASSTMQVDALVDPDAVLEDSSAGEEEAPADEALESAPSVSHAPPPLPKRGPKKSVVMAALVVVVALSIGAAVLASSVLTPALPVPAVVTPATAQPSVPTAPPVEVAPVAEAPRARAPLTIEAIEITGGGPEEDAGAE
jgi:hypothetical protein